MLSNRNEIRENKYFDPLTEAILDRDQPRTTDLFFRMTRDGHSVGQALAGWVKMPGERDCYARFERDWIYN